MPFLRTLRPRRGAGLTRVTIETTDGRTLGGRRLNHSSAELQLLSDDAEPRIHLLRAAGKRHRPVTSQVDWPTYNGDVRGNRHAAPINSLRSTFTIRSFLRVLRTWP